MASNSFGRIFRITTAGESHGPGLGVIIDGCPAGLELDEAYIQHELDRRRPGQSSITTQRKESDRIHIRSGVYDGKTTGAPIMILIPNEDQKSADYEHVAQAYRPSHADYTYEKKYGIRDHRGGGRSSARETVNWVAAGAIAKLFLQKHGIIIRGGVTSIGHLDLDLPIEKYDWAEAERNLVRCPDAKKAVEMQQLIEQVRQDGDTIGGIVTCVVEGLPVGLGEPVFHKLEADLAHAMLSINATKGFEIGSGFSAARMKGSEHNDEWTKAGSKTVTTTNHSGGIQGGISNGMPVYFRVAFKPVSTLMKDQKSVDRAGEEVIIQGKGRHDPCVVPRAVAIVEAMAALVLIDHLLLQKINL
ncbi:MAG TPA: chorismate synthase [Saprospiraceae bacterium]|nr:chorismate synthase [Saprospiraceae bacterium]